MDIKIFLLLLMIFFIVMIYYIDNDTGVICGREITFEECKDFLVEINNELRNR